MPALDGVRGLAVCAVLLFHLGRREFSGGYLGVDVFFVLSGYLITCRLLDGEVRGRLGLREFYRRRVLRILPALAIVVITCCVVALMQPTTSWAKPTLSGWPWVALSVGNWARATLGNDSLGLLNHTWSLSIEEQFYVLWPLVLAAILRFRLARAEMWVALLGLAVMTHRALMLLGGASLAEVFNATDTHTDGLLFGCALALWTYPRRDTRAIGRVAGERVLAISAWGGLVTLAALILVGAASAVAYALAIPMTVVAATLLSWSLAVTRPSAAAALSWRPMTWIGRRSYGIYLWHYPVYLLWGFHATGLRLLAEYVGAIAISIGLAALSFQVVERPALRRR